MSSYRDTVDELDSRLLEGLRRLGLGLLTLGYGLAVSLRNAAYDRGRRTPRNGGLPVISIGNITTGGTGKTPVVAWLVQQLSAQGLRPAIVSRGYRSLGPEGNDEKKMLDRMCPGTPHLQHPRRIRSVRQLAAENRADCIVLDDGFQHRQLHRELDIVLIDATNPWGGGRLLPLGRLREPLSGLRRADVILLTRCDLAEPASIQEIAARVARFTSVPVLRTTFAPVGWSNAAGDVIPLEAMRHRRALAFCGIGNPAGFRSALVQLGLEIPETHFVPFPDHHHYTADDLRMLSELAQARDCDTLLATHKDLVKIPGGKCGDLPVWALNLETNFEDDPAPLFHSLQTLFPNAF